MSTPSGCFPSYSCYTKRSYLRACYQCCKRIARRERLSEITRWLFESEFMPDICRIQDTWEAVDHRHYQADVLGRYEVQPVDQKHSRSQSENALSEAQRARGTRPRCE